MVYTERNKLAVIELDSETDIVPLDNVVSVLYEKLSSIVYCEIAGKLYGVISIGDISKTRKAGSLNVRINKKFTFILKQEYMHVRQIFREKEKINRIPVIDNEGKLLGDYTKWDDMITLQHSIPFKSNSYIINFWKKMNHVALVRPCNIFKQKQSYFEKWNFYLKKQGVQVDIIERMLVPDYIGKAKLILFTDEDELYATKCLLECILDKEIDFGNMVITYKEIADGIEYEIVYEILKLIQNKGVNILTIQCTDNGSNYIKNLNKSTIGKYVDIRKGSVLKEDFYKEFFCELFSDEYVDEIVHLGFAVEHKDGISKLKKHTSKYYNVENGERKTIGQPDIFSCCVYFYGPCIVAGRFVEDKYTIESFLQSKINNAGYFAKVSNLGCWGGMFTEIKRILETPLKKGDIVILYIQNNKFTGIPNINLANIMEEHNVPSGWVLDSIVHVNHKVNSLFADTIYESILPELNKETFGKRDLLELDNSFIKKSYIDRYFFDFNFSKYGKIGAIVMNCNPFTAGHRYLIETALNVVDFLIIFVVEEDRSVFTYDERYAMVCSGTSDLDNVKVVPSGPFILSQTTFPEYFIKIADEDIVHNVEYDITLFARQIAPYLNIQFRFVGEEPEDVVTKEYNEAMKRILPLNGIKVYEIPRKKFSDKYISASYVRKKLESGDINGFDNLVPESTKKILFWKNE